MARSGRRYRWRRQSDNVRIKEDGGMCSYGLVGWTNKMGCNQEVAFMLRRMENWPAWFVERQT